MRRGVMILALLAVVGLVAAACSGGVELPQAQEGDERPVYGKDVSNLGRTWPSPTTPEGEERLDGLADVTGTSGEALLSSASVSSTEESQEVCKA